MEEFAHHHTLPTGVQFNDMTTSQCLTTTGDLFFDVLAKIKELNSIKVINYMVQKISHHIIHRHLMEASTTSNSTSPQLKPTSSRIHWINLLQGFSSSLHPSDLTPHTFSLLTLVDILENVQKCLLGKHDRKTFRLLVQLFISVSQFPELQEDDENQQIIFDLQQEANAQELICQHRSRGNRSGNVERLCEAHPLPEFCEKIKVFVSSLIREKGSNLEAKILDGDSEHLEFSEPQEYGVFEVNDDPEEDEESATEGEGEEEEQMNLSIEQTPEPFDESGHDPIHVEPLQPPPQEPEQDVDVESPANPESEKGTSHKNQHKKRKTVKKWSATEESNLIKGVEQFGLGNWTNILNAYKFEGRTTLALLKKWQKMELKRAQSAVAQSAVAQSAVTQSAVAQSSCEPCQSTPLKSWTPTEESNLIKGVEQFGVRNWTEILNTYKFQDRTKRSLKEKWQRMRAQSAATSSTCQSNFRRCRWTPTEEENLRKAVEQFGTGNWTKIVKTYKFQGRSAEALHKKWKILSIPSSSSQQSSDDSESDSSDSEEEDTVSGDENTPSVGSSSNASRGQICSSSDSGITVTCKAKKKRIYWSPEEVIYLKKGVKKYGVGNWEKLLKTYPFHEERSLRSLNDKWHALHRGYKSNTKQQQVAKSPKHKRAIMHKNIQSTTKRKTVTWSQEELQWIEEGVQTLGTGKGNCIEGDGRVISISSQGQINLCATNGESVEII